MGDPWERSPWGPWNDYGRSLCGAEEAVGAIVDQILTDGGTLLWQKYLERKAFTFAASTITEAMVSHLRMCYVHHDPGEGPGEELDEGWEIEDEPEAGDIDSWARMHLPVRRLVRDNEGAGGSTKTSRFGRRNPPSRGRPNSKGAEKKEKEVPPRSTPLESAIEIDQEEERLRDAKAQELARARDRERKAKESDRNKEEERKKVSQLHEEMSKRPHTFDTEGNLIWVDEFKAERLPKLMEAFGYAVKRDPRQRTGEDMKSTMGSTGGMAPNTPDDSRKNNSKKRPQRSKKKIEMEPEFTDGFSKLQHGQPPIMETMVVMPGVTLESVGKRKSGPEANTERFMSRKEYVQLAEREVAMDGGNKGSLMFGSAGEASPQPGSMETGGLASLSGGGPTSPAGAAEGASPSPGAAPGQDSAAAVAAAMEAAGGGGKAGAQGTLPPIPAGRGGAPAAAAGGGPAYPGGGATRRPQGGGPGGPATGGEKKEGGPAQKAPPAPPPFTRNKKFEALGFVRDPRYRVPELGGPQGFGSAQPPLGATMGHGLIKSGSHKEAYFFPPSVPELPSHLLRSASDTAIGSARASARKESARRGPNADKAGEESQEDDHGRLKAEMSPAYRSFRHALMPAESSQGLNGFSGPMSGSGTFRR